MKLFIHVRNPTAFSSLVGGLLFFTVGAPMSGCIPCHIVQLFISRRNRIYFEQTHEILINIFITSYHFLERRSRMRKRNFPFLWLSKWNFDWIRGKSRDTRGLPEYLPFCFCVGVTAYDGMLFGGFCKKYCKFRNVGWSGLMRCEIFVFFLISWLTHC